MLFHSFDFLVFFLIVVVLYFATFPRFRWVPLLAGSYYFYACWKLEYVILIMASTLVDYWAGIKMGKIKEKAKRKPYLYVSVIFNLGLLFAFKYASFFNEGIRNIFDSFNVFYGIPAFEIIWPVGISYYTFQTMGYSIDVYRGKKTPERHLGIFALYVSFFPQLLAGPIERSTQLLPQLLKTHKFDWERTKSGLLLMVWGFFKKLVIADRLYLYVGNVYAHPQLYDGLQLLVASYLLLIRLYCDFSGYCDIAIGAARIMGFELTDNFNRPLVARNIRGFWQRWHITLTRWLFDYVYFPLARGKPKGWHRHGIIVFVFTLIGLWHSPTWGAVAFGSLNGFYLVFSDLTRGLRKNATDFFLQVWGMISRIFGVPYGSGAEHVHAAFQRFFTYSAVSFSAVFFFADSLDSAILILKRISDISITTINPAETLQIPGLGIYEMMLGISGVLAVMILERVQGQYPTFKGQAEYPVWIRLPLAHALLLSVLMFGIFTDTPFAYFQY